MWGVAMPPMTHVLFLHEFMGMPCHTLSHSKFFFPFFKLSWKRCTYFIKYYIEYIWALTCWLFVLCHLSTILFCVNFQKNEKNKIKKGIFHCRFPFFCWKKIAKFWKKNKEKVSPHFPSASVALATGCYSLPQHFNLMQLWQVGLLNLPTFLLQILILHFSNSVHFLQLFCWTCDASTRVLGWLLWNFKNKTKVAFTLNGNLQTIAWTQY